MAKKVVNMIEYTGLSDSLPTNPTTFTQIILSSDLCLSSQKPDIQRVVRINSSIIIDATNVIKTPLGTSLEGQILTGYKLIVHGTMKYSIVYVADDGTQTLHSASFKIPFCEFIVLPSTYIKSTPVDVVPYIEDVIICNDCICPNEDTSRCVTACATLFLNVRFCCQEVKSVCCSGGTCPKVIGISSVLPTTITYFKQFTSEEVFQMPSDNGCVDELLSISSSLTLDSVNLVQTITGTSLEGQNLSGCKLAISLNTKDIILYSNSNSSACNTVQSITFNNKICCVYVIVPCEINGQSISDLLSQGNIVVTPYIEDICASITEDCNLYKCMTALVNVTTRCI